MPPPLLKIEVIDLTGDSIDEIQPERPSDLEVAAGILPPSVQASEVWQVPFARLSILSSGERSRSGDLVQHPYPELRPGLGDAAVMTASLVEQAASTSRNPLLTHSPSLSCGDDAAGSREQPIELEARGWEDEVGQDHPASIAPRPSLVARSKTAVNAVLAKLRRSKRLAQRRQTHATRTATLPARSRSSSVEYLYGRTAHTPSAPAVAQTRHPGNQVAGIARLTRRAKKLLKPRHLDYVRSDHKKFHETAARATARLSDLTGAVKDSAELVMYTDGSIRSGRYGGGAVVYKTGGVWAGRAVALGELSDSNQAEMSAIFASMKLARTLLQPGQRRLTIVTDSSCCLGWIADGCRDSDYMEPVVTAARKEQERFAREGIMVAFQWVKGHAGTEGNKMADKLAGFASDEASKGFMRNYDVPNIIAHLEPAKKSKASAASDIERQTGARRERKLLWRREMLSKTESLPTLATAGAPETQANIPSSWRTGFQAKTMAPQ